MKKYATIDVGTNSVLLLIVESDDRKNVTTVLDRAEITRLGEKAKQTGELQSEAMARTLSVLSEYAEQIRLQGATLLGAVATAAVRDAVNGRLFQMMAQAVGIPLQIISGDDEALLSLLSVMHDPPPVHSDRWLVMDVGGGSTEFILSEHQKISYRHSLDIGSVRLTEKWIQHHPIAKEQLKKVLQDIEEELKHISLPGGSYQMVGLAGTITTLAAIHHRLDVYRPEIVHYSKLQLKDVETMMHELAAMSLEKRMTVSGLPEKRADVIVAGAALVYQAMKHFKIDQLWVSDRGVRWGLMWRKLAS